RYRLPDHDLADGDRGCVRGRIAHASAHVRIERQVHATQQHLALARRCERYALQAKASEIGGPARSGCEHNAAVRHGVQVPPRVRLPTNVPTPAVTAIASALQPVTD